MAVTSNVDGATDAVALTLDFQRRWWLWLLIGCAWMFASLVILQFEEASVRTVGVIVGCMFVALGAQNLVQAVFGTGYWWLYTAFGIVFVACGIACFLQPAATFAGVADMLGFLFMLVGIWWTVEALLMRADFPLWWMKLLAGIAMNLPAFGGPAILHPQGLPAARLRRHLGAVEGVSDIARAFELRASRASDGLPRRAAAPHPPHRSAQPGQREQVQGDVVEPPATSTTTAAAAHDTRIGSDDCMTAKLGTARRTGIIRFG